MELPLLEGKRMSRMNSPSLTTESSLITDSISCEEPVKFILLMLGSASCASGGASRLGELPARFSPKNRIKCLLNRR